MQKVMWTQNSDASKLYLPRKDCGQYRLKRRFALVRRVTMLFFGKFLTTYL